MTINVPYRLVPEVKRARRKIEEARKRKALIPGAIPVARDKDTLVGRVAVTISKLARLPPRESLI